MTKVVVVGEGNYDVQAHPRLVKVNTSASFSTLTAAGWLNDNSAVEILATDIVAVNYAGDVRAFLTVAIDSAGIITLSAISNPGEVTLVGAAVAGYLTMFSGTTGDIADSLIEAVKVLQSSLSSPDVNANIVNFNVTVGQAALASAALVALITSSASKQYKILELFINSGGTNFSGGGGDRLGQVTDGTSVYSVVPAASLQTLANGRWGDTAIAFPASVAINVSTVAGANLSFAYSGGATDYTAGSVVISGSAVRVA